MTQFFDQGSRRREREREPEAGARPDEHRRPEDGEGELTLGRESVRVPAVFERELRRLAETFRVPVTNLVRAVLEDAVAMADHASENVETRLKRLASSLEQERDKLRRRIARDPLDGVFAFQPIKLAQAAACARCKKDLRRGESANLGLHDDPRAPSPRVFVCDECVPAE